MFLGMKILLSELFLMIKGMEVLLCNICVSAIVEKHFNIGLLLLKFVGILFV